MILPVFDGNGALNIAGKSEFAARKYKGDVKMARLELSTAITGHMEFAAQAGAPDALFELGMLYATGRDIDMDLVSAHKWFNLAAARGNVSAKTYRVELSQEMTTDQISEAQKQAREWLQTH